MPLVHVDKHLDDRNKNNDDDDMQHDDVLSVVGVICALLGDYVTCPRKAQL